MILTNKYSVIYNMEAINEDFDIFVIEKKTNKLDDTNLLDLETDKYKARAVQYSWGKKAFSLFEKGAVLESEYRNAITKDYQDVIVRKMNILDEEECKAFYYQKRLLAQLLINSLHAPKNRKVIYNNLSGKLFYSDPTWRTIDSKTNKPYMVYFLEISFDPGMYLNLNVKTFMTKQQNFKKRYYIFDPKTKCFRKKLTTDSVNKNELFSEASFKDKKNTVKYFDFKNFDNFKKCKLGILEQFTQDVEKSLGKYITLIPGQRDEDMVFEISKKNREKLFGSNYSSILSKRGINIVDECHDEKSAAIVKRLIQEFETFYGITALTGELKQEMYNIRIIHNEEYYECNKQIDPHISNVNKFIIQHITVEDCSELINEMAKKESPIIHKIIVELILKGDVRSKKISIYNWSKLSNRKDWSFVIRRKLENKDGKINEIDLKKKRDNYEYFLLKIKRDGSLRFTSFDDIKLENEDYIKISFTFDSYFDTQKNKYQKYVEGLVFSNIDNIHAIIRTNEKTMPNTRNIWNGLKETYDKDELRIDSILNILDEYIKNYPDDKNYINELKNALKNFLPSISKKQLRKLMQMRKGAAKRLNRFMHEFYGIRVSAEIKNKDFENEYMIDNLLNIRYFEEKNTDGTGESSFNYYVGPIRNSLQCSIHNASIIRQVQAEGEIEFKDLLPLMAVDFVRIGMYTVLPFPFKYLREYSKMQ